MPDVTLHRYAASALAEPVSHLDQHALSGLRTGGAPMVAAADMGCDPVHRERAVLDTRGNAMRQRAPRLAYRVQYPH
jgi:hypothetical protein